MLRLEYERHGYTAHIEMFNSKYWNVPQNRDRYAVVGTRNKKNLTFTFPKEQHEFVPKLSDYLEKDVPEKYYLPDEKAQTIIAQALEKLEGSGKCHACITPDRINKRQNGPRAKAEDEPMFTLTAQDLHGVIILEDEQTEESVVTDIAEETGLLDPNGCGKTLRVGGGGSITKKHNYQHVIVNPGGGQRATEFPITVTVNKCGRNVLKMVKEAAKAELITNAVNAEVPGYYIQAMITGKKPDFLNTLDAEEEETGFRTEYEQITGAVVSIFEAWEKENGVESAAAGLHRLIDDLSKNRIEELRVIRENREAENAILSKLLIPPLRGDESRAEETESEGTQHDADGGSTEDKRTE